MSCSYCLSLSHPQPIYLVLPSSAVSSSNSNLDNLTSRESYSPFCSYTSFISLSLSFPTLTVSASPFLASPLGQNSGRLSTRTQLDLWDPEHLWKEREWLLWRGFRSDGGSEPERRDYNCCTHFIWISSKWILQVKRKAAISSRKEMGTQISNWTEILSISFNASAAGNSGIIASSKWNNLQWYFRKAVAVQKYKL